eukprot:TRINITY_DN32505_c0_g1_i1.p1 TRINITY_DN32505_c0_g1~~TRINITY_DN32505_c0_g1_i1.p1  ORF type:complete len:279 (-),score=53.68 TRINITY_DN32505_c0_g1_i1:1027-1863(-)
MEQKLSTCCISGYVASGEPRGEMQTIGGVQCYVSKPKDGASYNGRAVIYATDVFGLGLVNAKLLADTYAEKGNFLVVVPDLFGGAPLPTWILDRIMLVSNAGKQPTSTIGCVVSKATAVVSIGSYMAPFMLRHAESSKMPLMENVIQGLKTELSITKIGLVGLCYGGYYCLRFGAVEDKIDAFVSAHTQIKVPEDIQPLKKPGLFICVENDWAFSNAKRAEAEALMSKREDAENYKFKLYPGTYHGFVARGDENTPVIQAAKEDAAKEAVEFLQKHLK